MDPSTGVDASDLNLVSGFYGPGTFASWLLTLTTSWFTLLLRLDSSGNTDLLPHLLYVNCAAIDTLRRFIVFQRGKGASQNPFTAAFTITIWGLMHNHVQIYVCREVRTRAARRRYPFLFLGSIIPQIASIAMVVGFFYNMEGVWSQIDPESFDAPQILLIVAAVSLHVAVLIATIRLFYVRNRRNFRLDMFVDRNDRSLVMAAFISNLSAILYFGLPLGTSKLRCVVVPCAPQALLEQDQLFALVAGLVMSAYHVIPQAYKMLMERRRPDLDNIDDLDEASPAIKHDGFRVTGASGDPGDNERRQRDKVFLTLQHAALMAMDGRRGFP